MPEKEDWTREELERYAEKMTAITIPVDVRMEGKTHVFDFTEVEALLRDSTLIALGNCGCRKPLQKCDAPLDVCLAMDKEAEAMMKESEYQKVTIDQALEALKRSHDAGLVHLAFINEGDTRPFIICSCCACCCHALSGLIRFGIPEAVTAAKLVAKQDLDACSHCGLCVERCHFQARRLEQGELVYDPSKCFGCGVCVTTCPTNAITLTKRDNVV
jgi:ferredoxin